MQVVTTGGLLLWLVPAAAIQFGGGWSHVVATIGPSQVGVGVQVALVPLAMGLRAVMEFLRRGGGTPIPYDPPIALVESGPYAYLRNPMQAAIVAFFVIAAAFLRNVALLGAGAFAFAYSAGLAEWHENGQLLDRFGEGWVRYRAHVRAWVPRCRPYVRRNSTLYVAFTCGTCSSVGRWFLARHPIGLEIAPAEAALGKIRRRVTYVSPSGSSSEGIAAIAHALEHIHIGWAAVGWLLMLPGIRHVAQLLADVCGPGPQVVAGRTYEPNVCETGS
jgi:protein-S-isoprenylcysteine O-methyltransferase Ste14